MRGMVVFVQFLAVVAALLVGGESQASTFGFGFVTLTGTTLLGGSVTVTAKVPGTFNAVVPNDPTSGRFLKDAYIWADAPVIGDQVTTLQVVDTDGVIPSPMRVAFANYPIIFDMLDTVSGITPSLGIPPNGYLAGSFDTNGQPAARFIPSGLYIKMTFASGSLSISKTFRALIRWGIWQ